MMFKSSSGSKEAQLQCGVLVEGRVNLQAHREEDLGCRRARALRSSI